MGNSLTFEQVWTMFQETDKKFQETDKKIKEVLEAIDKSAEERRKELKETRKKLKELDKLFNGHWGKLVEALVDSALIEVLQSRGINVNRTGQRIQGLYEDKEYEIDIVALNGEEVVLVEVKTTLRPEHVQEFLEKLEIAKKIFPEYKSFRIYGAIAYLHAESESKQFAMKKGLFVIRAASKSAKIMNPQDFQPRVF